MPDSLTHDHLLRWGILGAGGIAHTVAADIRATDGNRVTAVAARDADRAATFAGAVGAAQSYGDYAALVQDPDVDVVYIATTHPGHRDQALMAIAAGKAVLIEKPTCLNAADARTVFGAARAADVFSMEAMWMRTNPLIRKAETLVDSGAIGEVRSVRVEHGLGLAYDPAHRLYDLANGGGSLLDLGIYPVTFAHLFLGRPDRVSVMGSLAPTGCDETVAMQWGFADGRDGQLWCSTPNSAPGRGLVVGTEGWIATEGPFYRPTGLRVHSGGQEQRVADPMAGGGHGYGPEIAEVARCMRAGLLESPLVPHADTIAIMGLLDEARAELGVRYPGE